VEIKLKEHGQESKKKPSAAAAAAGAASGQLNNTNNGGIRNSNNSSLSAADSNNETAAMDVMEPIAELDVYAWEERFPFAEKTSDPLARELDMAHDLFLKGIQLLATATEQQQPSNGNADDDCYYAASIHIASAYVLDERVLNLYTGNETAEGRALSTDMFLEMLSRASKSASSSTNELRKWRFPSSILAFISVEKGLMEQFTALQRTQQFITSAAMTGLSLMLTVPEDALQQSCAIIGQLGGWLTHARVYYLRGRLYKLMFNGKSAHKDWVKAIELDPSLAVARLERLRL
jgi:hypothetical protein